MRARLWALCGVFAVTCGSPNSTSQDIGPTGGEVCLPDGRACIDIPFNAVEQQVKVVIEVTDAVPPAAQSEGFEITTGLGPIWFKKEATVTLKYAIDGGFSPNLLRVFTLDDAGTWVPLADGEVDRTRQRISGKTWHLSPFVLLRADRLPDGGLPIELDGGPPPSPPPPPPPPPFDASRPDSGYDAGRPDSGAPDSGTPDSGTPDSGTPDSGTPDSGTPDAGTPDAGTPDAGTPDAGTPDAGTPDAGDPDAGMDAGVDAGNDDGGTDGGDGG